MFSKNISVDFIITKLLQSSFHFISPCVFKKQVFLRDQVSLKLFFFIRIPVSTSISLNHFISCVFRRFPMMNLCLLT